MKLLNYLENHKKQSSDQQVPGTLKYFNIDNKKNLKVSSRLEKPSWRYNTEQVYYTLNSQGYRCPEFLEIPWDESILFFGCSHIFGTGVDNIHTIPCFFEQKTGIPCVNLGIPGSSTMAHIYNSEILNSYNVKPQGIVILYPDPVRYTTFYYHKKQESTVINSYGTWNLRLSDKDHSRIFVENLSQDDYNLKVRQSWNEKLFKMCWDCEIFEYTYKEEYDFLKKHNSLLINSLDRARDRVHHGPLSNEKAAEDIIEDMKTRGFL